MPEFEKHFKSILPSLSKFTGTSLVTLIGIVALYEAFSQAGQGGIASGLILLLSSAFGDVIAGPLVQKLFGGDIEDGELKELIKQFEEQLEQNEIKKALVELLFQQKAFAGAIGVALQYHENSTVERIVRSVAGFFEIGAIEIVKQISEEFKTDIKSINPEILYLTDLIGNMDHYAGAWTEYVSLPIQFENPTNYRLPKVTSQWRLPRIYALLEESLQTDDTIISPASSYAKFDSLEEIIAQYPRLVLIGEPGAGKTTTLRHLSLAFALKRLADPHNTSLPLLLNLSRWKKRQSIEDFILAHWRQVSDPLGLLTHGNIILLLDGLNEMGEAHENVSKLKNWLKTEYSPQKLVVTCREHNYIDKFNLSLPVVRIEEMDAATIARFASNYLSENRNGFLRQILPTQKEGNQQTNLFRFAQNPFLLVALMVIYQSSPQQALPTNQGVLFQRLASVLWERERQRPRKVWVTYTEAAPILAYTAFNLIYNKQPSSIPMSSIETFIAITINKSDKNLTKEQYEKARLIIEIAQNASFFEIQGDYIRFFHELVRDYFAAIYVDEIGIERILEMMQKWLDIPHVGKLRSIPIEWHQVIINAFGISNTPDHFLKSLLLLDPYLAVDCVVTRHNISLETLLLLVGHLRKRRCEIRVGIREKNRRLTHMTKSWEPVDYFEFSFIHNKILGDIPQWKADIHLVTQFLIFLVPILAAFLNANNEQTIIRTLRRINSKQSREIITTWQKE